ncbi:MAG: spore cortex-lytic enzyme [Clostridia bacterium]|nr:spore cortex-lytic enzyme [Clostridia bacterium]
MGKSAVFGLVLGVLLTAVGVRLGGAETALPAALQQGASGEQVRQVQQALRDLGYEVGAVDGVYGSRTRAAVLAFQRDRGLTQDGVAGRETLAALGIQSSAGGTTAASLDLDLLARVISAEAKGEPYAGQVAVGAVILNRIEHPSFPNTLAGVVYQAGAFESVSNGEYAKAAEESCVRAAREAIAGSDPSGGAIYFYNPAKTSNRWMLSRPVIATIGRHVFCS